ncbi:hypothetical protein SB659_04085 [Arthrobacter sp. SIMBA_036]|uniref:hypothetical protein n=1 Tax=Arthrobacter sp. SIMBA_036 TaxID=3085778 RepID=UPI00397B27C4
MGLEDSIRNAAENAMEDLAGTSKPVNDAEVPDPGEKDDDIQVHSSISEGSNAMDEDLSPKDTPHTEHHKPQGQAEANDGGTHQDESTDDDVPVASGDVASGDVAGPAGLPSGDPDNLRADPSEGGGDPSTSMGRG